MRRRLHDADRLTQSPLPRVTLDNRSILGRSSCRHSANRAFEVRGVVVSAIENEHELEDETTTVEPVGDEQTIELAVEDTSVRALQTALRELGWSLQVDGTMDRETFTAVRRFQRGFAWWELLVDGYAGPKTWEAIEHARTHGGRCSAHFAFREFRCR